MLTANEKIDIINQHIRSVLYLKYNAELDKIEAICVTNPNENTIDAIDERIENCDLKILALEAEKAKLAE